jgi:hypothetical protein
MTLTIPPPVPVSSRIRMTLLLSAVTLMSKLAQADPKVVGKIFVRVTPLLIACTCALGAYGVPVESSIDIPDTVVHWLSPLEKSSTKTPEGAGNTLIGSDAGPG